MVGDLVRGLICFLTAETRTTIWILRRNETLDGAICCKLENESVYIFLTFSLTLEIEIKGEEESSSFEDSHGKGKCKLVNERKACEDPLAALPCNGGQSSQEKWKKPALPAKWKEVSHTVEELGMLAKDQRGTWVKKLQGKFKKRKRCPCHGGRIGLSRKSR